MTSRELAELLDKQATLTYGDGITWPVRILDGRSAYGRLDVKVSPSVNAELLAALAELTVIGKTDDGGVIIGPQGWERFTVALARRYDGCGDTWVSAERVRVRG